MPTRPSRLWIKKTFNTKKFSSPDRIKYEETTEKNEDDRKENFTIHKKWLS